MSNDPIADERAYWLNYLGIADDGSSLADLRNRTPGAVHVNKAMAAGSSGVAYLTQAQADARYVQLANAIPLSSTTPIKSAKNGVVGTEGAASHGDHVHPVPAIIPSIIYKPSSAYWVSALRTSGNTATNGLNKLYLVPYPLFANDFRDFTLSSVGVRCTTLQAASNARVGLYKSLPTGEVDWANLLFDLSIATTATGDLSAALSNLVVVPGLYWAAVVQQGAVATLDAAVASTIPIWQQDTSGMQTPGALAVTGVTGALPTTTPSMTVGNEPMANLFLRMV